MSAFVYEHPHIPASKRQKHHLISACDRCRRQKRKCRADERQSACKTCVSTGFDCTFLDRVKDIARREQFMFELISAEPNFFEFGLSDIRDKLDPKRTTQAPTSGTLSKESIQSSDPDDIDNYLSACAILHCPFEKVESRPTGLEADLTSSTSPCFLMLEHNSNDCLFTLHAIQVFFKIYGHMFPFLDRKRLADDYQHSALPFHLTILIVLVSLPHLKQDGSRQTWFLSALEAKYAELAKVHLSLQWDCPTVDAVHAFILMAHYERSKGDDKGELLVRALRHYFEKSLNIIKVAQKYERKAQEAGNALRLGDRSAIDFMGHDEEERSRLQALANYLWTGTGCPPSPSSLSGA